MPNHNQKSAERNYTEFGLLRRLTHQLGCILFLIKVASILLLPTALASPSQPSLELPPTRLSGELSGSVLECKISPDGDYLVFTVETDDELILELYSVPTSGDSPPVLSEETMVRTDSIKDFEISEDSQHVVYM